MSRQKKIAITCVIIGLACISFAFYLKQKRDADRLIGKQNAWADKINDSTQKTFTPLPVSATVLVGTSITANWNVSNNFDSLPVANRGIHSNTITHIRKRIPQICRSKPAAIVLEGGINDIYNGKDKFVIFQEIWDIIDSILIISPKTQIYLTSILPVSSKGDSAKYNPIIREVNAMVQSMVLKVYDDAARYPDRAGNVLNLHYVDYTKGITDFMYTDDVHLNSQGYLTLEHILKPFLDEAQSKNSTNAH